jgi:hypothetical protein
VGGQDDLVAALQVIMAAKREKLGELLTPEELLAFRDDQMEPEARERIADEIALDPDAARALADLAAFPEVEPAPGTRIVSEEEIDAGWQAFRRRLPDRPAASMPPVSTPISTPLGAPPQRSPWRYPGLRLAAAALVGLAVGWAAGFAGHSWRGFPGPAINVQIEELAPSGSEDGIRSSESWRTLPEGIEELVLVLGARGGEERDFPQYEVEVADLAGRRVWARKGLRPTPLGTFHLSFHRGDLPPGSYRIDLYGSAGKGRTLLASYALRFQIAGEA